MSVPENMKQITDLVKEQSSAVNPILPQDNLFCNKGVAVSYMWQGVFSDYANVLLLWQ